MIFANSVRQPAYFLGPRAYLLAGAAPIDLSAVYEADPSTIFGASDKGFIYDFTDQTKLFQNAGGTTPVTAATNPIGYVTDLSGRGNHATEGASAGTTWDGSAALVTGSHALDIPAIDLSGTNKITVIACVQTSTTGGQPFWHLGSTAQGSAALGMSGGGEDYWTATAYGSGGASVSSSNTRSVLSAAFKVVTAVLDLSTGLTTCRINGEVYGSVGAASDAAVNFANTAGWLFRNTVKGATGRAAWMMLISRHLTNAELLGAEKHAALQAGLTIISEAPPAGQAYYNLIDSYGQSLSVGAYGDPVLSSTTRFNDKMFVGGVLTPTGTTIQALVEATETISGTACGETPVSGMAEMIHELGYANPFIGVANGFPASPIADLSQGTSPYNIMLTHVTNAWRAARSEDKHFKVRAFNWMQGESDGVNVAYAAALNTLRTNLNTDVKAITLQTEDLWLLSYQLDRPKLGLAHLAASDSYSNIKVAFPSYCVEHVGDGVHLSAIGSKVAGAYFGLAYDAIIVDGNTSWSPLRIQSHVRSGAQLDLVYNPVGTLAFDTTVVAAQTNRGFRLYQPDGTAAITINSVAVVGTNTIRITTSASIPANAILRVGFADPADTAAGMIKTNLRDSQGDTIIFNGGGLNYPMHNWCVGEQLVVA